MTRAEIENMIGMELPPELPPDALVTRLDTKRDRDEWRAIEGRKSLDMTMRYTVGALTIEIDFIPGRVLPAT